MYALTFLELVTLKGIVIYYENHQRAPVERELLDVTGGEHAGLINSMLETSGILKMPAYKRLQYSDRLTSNVTLRSMLERLVENGLITSGKHTPTDAGIRLEHELQKRFGNLTRYPLNLTLSKDNRIYESKSIFPIGV